MRVDDREVNLMLQDVCKMCNITFADLNNDCRKKELVFARSIACYLLKYKFHLTYQNMQIFIPLHHSTIINMLDKMKNLLITQYPKDDYAILDSFVTSYNVSGVVDYGKHSSYSRKKTYAEEVKYAKKQINKLLNEIEKLKVKYGIEN